MTNFISVLINRQGFKEFFVDSVKSKGLVASINIWSFIIDKNISLLIIELEILIELEKS